MLTDILLAIAALLVVSIPISLVVGRSLRRLENPVTKTAPRPALEPITGYEPRVEDKRDVG